MKTILKQIISPVSTDRGAPMGRPNVDNRYQGKDASGKPFTTSSPILNDKVPMCKCCGAYDIGGAYWGTGNELRVRYTKELDFIEFYRVEPPPAPVNYVELLGISL